MPVRLGQKDEGDQALGRSRGGFSSKLHAACDAPRALGLIGGIKTKAVLADRAYDSNAILDALMFVTYILAVSLTLPRYLG